VDLLHDALDVATSLGATPLEWLIVSLARRRRLGVRDALDDPGLGLTSREHEVLRTLCTGATNRQIATALFISERTASVHVSNIIRKLGVSNRGEAVAAAWQRGLSPTTGPDAAPT
jgi:DNA-binding NarL/FixJ family response regulator